MDQAWELMWLCLASAAGGAVNSVAGGGTLITFPTLLWVLQGHMDAIGASEYANTTSTFALFPGSLASMAGYRREIVQIRKWLWLLLPSSIIGGLLGSYLLLASPATFKELVPWLILSASLLFLLQPLIARWTGIGLPHAAPSKATLTGIVVLQFLIAVYGGYFGAGIGILMLSGLALMGMSDIHEMNGLKTVLATVINGLAVANFVLNDKVVWKYALPMTAAAIAGGFLGAATARKLNRQVVRWIVISIGIGLSGYYFWKTYG